MGKNSDTYNTYLLKWANVREPNIAERKQCMQRKTGTTITAIRLANDPGEDVQRVYDLMISLIICSQFALTISFAHLLSLLCWRRRPQVLIWPKWPQHKRWMSQVRAHIKKTSLLFLSRLARDVWWWWCQVISNNRKVRWNYFYFSFVSNAYFSSEQWPRYIVQIEVKSKRTIHVMQYVCGCTIQFKCRIICLFEIIYFEQHFPILDIWYFSYCWKQQKIPTNAT